MYHRSITTILESGARDFSGTRNVTSFALQDVGIAEQVAIVIEQEMELHRSLGMGQNLAQGKSDRQKEMVVLCRASNLLLNWNLCFPGLRSCTRKESHRRDLETFDKAYGNGRGEGGFLRASVSLKCLRFPRQQTKLMHSSRKILALG